MQVIKENTSTVENFLDDKITIQSDILKLELEFKITPNKEYGINFDVYANFYPRGFYKNKPLSLKDKLSILSQYRQFLDSSMANNSTSSNSQNNPSNIDKLDNVGFKNPVSYFKNLFSKLRAFYEEVKYIPQLLKDIRALHVVTYVDDELLVRSTVELNADIYNILSDKLPREYYQKTFVLHICNMKYGQYLIQKRIRKFFESIEPVSKSIGTIISFLYILPWVVFELINLQTGNLGQVSLDGQSFDLLYILSSTFGAGNEIARLYDTIIRVLTQFIGIPFIISKIIPKIAMQIMRKTIF